MNNKCYYCAGLGILTSDEMCECLSGKCKCYPCAQQREYEKVLQSVKVKKKGPIGWEQPELPFNKHKQFSENKGWDKENAKKRITNPLKPDPATVEAELQMEEELWNL